MISKIKESESNVSMLSSSFRPFLCYGAPGGFLLIALFALTACAPRGEGAVFNGQKVFGGKGDALRSETSGKNDLLTINSVMIAPIAVARDLNVDAATVERFKSLLIEQFTAESGIDIVAGAGGSSARTGVAPLKGDRGAPPVASDATLHTEITRFAEGKGSALGATSAALFAANFSIVRASDKKEIWTSSYFSTEHPDSINLIEVTQRIGREGAKGNPTVDLLVVEAARGAALDFSNQRVEQFSRK